LNVKRVPFAISLVYCTQRPYLRKLLSASSGHVWRFRLPLIIANPDRLATGTAVSAAITDLRRVLGSFRRRLFALSCGPESCGKGFRSFGCEARMHPCKLATGILIGPGILSPGHFLNVHKIRVDSDNKR
jgi:hypothetical protein